jgi:prepilin-type N-terminal cleavage/methylation domain-containing protein
MSPRGFTLVELMLVVSIIGILAVLVTPSFVSFWHTSALQAGARQLATVLNLGRQIAITLNTTVCVEAIGTAIRLRQNGCSGAIWMGPGTDGAGVIRISEPGALLLSTTANVVFTGLGAASPAGTYRMTNPLTGGTLTVVVAATGRVSVR